MRLAILAGTVLLALSACARDEEPAQANMEDQMQNEMMANEMVMPPPMPMPAENLTNDTAPEPVEAPPVISQDDIQDDADASGMTARLPAEDDTAPANATEE